MRPPHGRRDSLEPLGDYRAQHPHQWHQGDQHRHRHQHGRNIIRHSTAPGEPRDRPRLEGTVQHRGHRRNLLVLVPATAPRARASTTKVSRKSVSPAAIYAPALYWSLNSAAVAAILVAKVEPPSNSDQPNAVWVPRKMIRSATVSPRARPRPNIAPLMYPDRPNGSTVVLTTSHRVAPSASAASI